MDELCRQEWRQLIAGIGVVLAPRPVHNPYIARFCFE